jgi:hypothetical protein
MTGFPAARASVLTDCGLVCALGQSTGVPASAGYRYRTKCPASSGSLGEAGPRGRHMDIPGPTRSRRDGRSARKPPTGGCNRHRRPRGPHRSRDERRTAGDGRRLRRACDEHGRTAVLVRPGRHPGRPAGGRAMAIRGKPDNQARGGAERCSRPGGKPGAPAPRQRSRISRIQAMSTGR